MVKDKEYWQELGISEEKYTKIVLELEHAHVTYRLTGLDEIGYAKNIFPNLNSEDIIRVIYALRMAYWSGRHSKD